MIESLGDKLVEDAVSTGVTKSIEGVGEFLKLVCAPALGEIGLMMKDKVREWRLENILKILDRAKGKLGYEGGELVLRANPRVGLSIVENGSLIDSDELQELWAGLFVSSCTEDGKDDQNLIYSDMLKQLTVVQARVVKYCCEARQKMIYFNGLVVSDDVIVEYSDLVSLTGTDDLYRLDGELDHLRVIGLIRGGIASENTENIRIDITPTILALNLFVKCQGSSNSVAEYWKGNMIVMRDVLDNMIKASH